MVTRCADLLPTRPAGVWRGGRFTRFKCPCCGYSPTEAEWRKDLADFESMSDNEQRAARQAHNEVGVGNTQWRQHHQQFLFMPPGVRCGMEAAGVDNLHLIYLNIFKMLFKYTIHENLPLSKKKLIRNYLKAAGFYSYDATAADEENPVMRWIGREVKHFLAEAHVHVPFLLRVASAPADMDADMATMMNAAGELQLEEDDELNLGSPTEGELAQEEMDEPVMMKNADRWDNFLSLVDESNKEWATPADDTDDYRKGRAVAFFNAATVVARDIYALNPELTGWVLHVLVFVVARQYLSMGNPARRSCDACEALGSSMKKIIKHLTCRRRTSASQIHSHRSANGAKLWVQTFKRGYIEQTFRRVCVRAELLHGEGNTPYLQRADHRLLTKGKVAADKASSSDAPMSVTDAMEVPWVWSKDAALAVWS